MYMMDSQARDILNKTGRFLADLGKITDDFILPEDDEELARLLTITSRALALNQPITVYTPFCPDWSRDSKGRYNFKSLGGEESFIAKKYFIGIKSLFSLLSKHDVPYRAVLLFADWGLETQIDAKDTYGRKLSAEDVQMCFQSTLAQTDEHLLKLQQGLLGRLYLPCTIVSMREFLENSGLNLSEISQNLRQFFTSDTRGRRLLDLLSDESYGINRVRLGLSEDQNRQLTLQSLIEYATLGQSFDEHSLIVACESKVTSKAYNLPRSKNSKVPTFYLKGKEEIKSGVNIL